MTGISVRDAILSRLPELLIAIGIIVMFSVMLLTRDDGRQGTCVIEAPRYTMACNGQYDCYRLDTKTGDVKEVQ